MTTDGQIPIEEYYRSTNPHTCTLTESGLVHSLVISVQI